MFFVLAIGAALNMAFPSQVDEIQHLSIIRAQYEQPTLLPDWGHYRVLREDDLNQWSDDANYINHPALYYLLLSPLMALTTNPFVYRLVDAALATAAFLIVVVAGHRSLAGTGVPSALFAVLAASFPKAVSVAGMINNDNLAAVAGAVFFAGVCGMPGGPWWIAAGLALAGWSKITAFVVLGCAAIVHMSLLAARQRRWPAIRAILPMGIGIAIGSLPYLMTLLRTGHLLWINVDHWRVPLAMRAHLDFAGFTSWFVGMFLMKWPAIEQPYPIAFVLIGFVPPLALAAAALWRNAEFGPACAAYLVGFAALFAIQFGFAWQSFQTLGDLTNTQTRYYNVLWPGLALGGSIVISRLAARYGRASWLIVMIYLLPTPVGGLFRGLSA